MSKDEVPKILRPKVPCLFCGERLGPEDKVTHHCWKEGTRDHPDVTSDREPDLIDEDEREQE